jgi:glucose dehydrogenase
MCDEGHESKLDAPRALPSRRDVLIAGAALVTAPLIHTRTATAQAGQEPATAVGRTVDWVSYGGDKASAKYSTLAQIDRTKF